MLLVQYLYNVESGGMHADTCYWSRLKVYAESRKTDSKTIYTLCICKFLFSNEKFQTHILQNELGFKKCFVPKIPYLIFTLLYYLNLYCS